MTSPYHETTKDDYVSQVKSLHAFSMELPLANDVYTRSSRIKYEFKGIFQENNWAIDSKKTK